MPREKILRECFRSFELRGGSRWAEAGQVEFIESVDNACDQWRFGADDCQADLLLAGEGH